MIVSTSVSLSLL